MNSDIENAKVAIKKEFAAKLMREEGLSFPAAWTRATREHPDLDEEFASETNASVVYRYDPAKAPLEVPKALKSILQDLQNEGLERVEAIEPSGKTRLVHGIDIGLISRVAE